MGSIDRVKGARPLQPAAPNVEMTRTNTNRLLGYPDDARLLILNADDFGMCQSVNEAIVGVLTEGVVRSTTLMIPCPWMTHAMHFLSDHAEIPFGVHLTVISDWIDYRWGPVAPREMVPSLINEAGYFYNFERMAEFLAQVEFDQLELEFRAQIEAVLAAGLMPTHLDWHCLRIDKRLDISELMFRLAREYGLAFRVRGRSFRQKVQDKGLPCVDFDFLDSSQLDSVNRAAIYADRLRTLPAGLSEWAIHPGLDYPELERGGNQFRQTDFDFWTSEQAKELVGAEGIVLLDYRALQDSWAEI